jgi:hypothetical protein
MSGLVMDEPNAITAAGECIPYATPERQVNLTASRAVGAI